MNLSDETKIGMYKTMLRIRRFEEKIEELVLTGKISGFVPPLYRGGSNGNGCLFRHQGDGLYYQHSPGTRPPDRQRRRCKINDG